MEYSESLPSNQHLDCKSQGVRSTLRKGKHQTKKQKKKLCVLKTAWLK